MCKSEQEFTLCSCTRFQAQHKYEAITSMMEGQDTVLVTSTDFKLLPNVTIIGGALWGYPASSEGKVSSYRHPAFPAEISQVWNSFPCEVPLVQSSFFFQRLLKTSIFQKANSSLFAFHCAFHFNCIQVFPPFYSITLLHDA